ncbi:MAG: hypothetical protein A2Z66_10810 [Chloroflexi bacterium RBG_13_66_10]|jgi:Fe-S-cluster-containing dehydrogenase component|nr:MAG: hypothetical protein A2Z66_10810 [Chloroflexi bacterium RBG_13_66_10]
MKPTDGSAPPGILVDSRLCTACRACELACHYHHTGAFGTARSSIRVTFDADTGAVGIIFGESCDGCRGEPSPFCVRFCAPAALRLTP